MNLRELEYIVTLADTKHFGKAAEQCFVSQPTLSGQIKKLEQELGVELFERTKRSVKITPAGDALLVLARDIIEKTRAMKQLAKTHSDPYSTPIRIGMILTLSPYLTPLIMLPLREKFPKMHMILSEEMTSSLLQRLSRHEIDAALLATPVDPEEFHSIPLFDEPFWFACPCDHELASKQALTQRDLESSELLLLSEGHCLSDQALEVCNLGNSRPDNNMADLRASSLETLLHMVGAGQGCTLVPALAIEQNWITDASIKLRPIEQSKAERRISLVFRRTYPRRKAIDAFATVVRDSLPDRIKLI